jgi:uncharacterized damage-inducible protein DinB
MEVSLRAHPKSFLQRGDICNMSPNKFQRFLFKISFYLIYLLVPAAIVPAQDKPAAPSAQNNPLSATNKRFYGGIKNMLLLSAQKVPEEYYSFKPTDAVRSYGQIIGHVADTHYSMCAIVLGEKRPPLEIEKTKTSKADLIAALKESFSYCDKVYNSMTDASAGQTVKFMGSDNTKFGVLTANLIHSGLHYGNLVTYMRLKNIVPPTSEPGFFEPKKK